MIISEVILLRTTTGSADVKMIDPPPDETTRTTRKCDCYGVYLWLWLQSTSTMPMIEYRVARMRTRVARR